MSVGKLAKTAFVCGVLLALYEALTRRRPSTAMLRGDGRGGPAG